MYRDSRYPSSSGPPPDSHSYSQSHSQSHPPGYDRYDAYPPPPLPPPPSSLPPPPPSHPPPPQRWDGRDGRDSRDDRNGYYPRERDDDYRFRGPYSDLREPRRSYRDSRDPRDSRSSRDEYRPPRSEFTFRQEAPAGITSNRAPHYPRYDDRGANTYASRYDDPRRTRGGRRPDQSRRPGPYQRREKEKAVDRLLLSKRFDDKPELMLGDTAARATYRDVDELSDSDEVDMDISDNGDSDANGPDRPTKRTRTDASVAVGTLAQDAPKWSNPDPYTALPPPETSRKKDVVQLIRKARVEAEARKPTVPAEAADFISCDFSDDDTTSRAADGVAEKRLSNVPLASRVASSTLPPKPPVSTPHQTLQHSEKVPTTRTQSQLQPQHPNPTKRDNKKSAPVNLTPTASLGNRKRNIDDEIKLPHTLLNVKKVNRMASGGSVVPIWQPVPGEDHCPWVVDDHSDVPNMSFRLHREIRDFYSYVSPRDFEERLRQELISKLESLVRRKWRDARVLPFGSFMSGLYLPTADMDIAICSQAFIDGRYPLYDKKKYLFHMKSYLENNKVAFQNTVEAITRAKVPLLKYTDNHTGLKVDISFEKMDGYKAIDTFRKWKEQYPAMPPLVAVIKHFLLMRHLNEPVNGGIGGFTVICMVVHLLQMMPQVQSGSMKDDHLGQLLMEFLNYYGNLFEYERVAIRMDPPGTLNKARASTLVYRNLDRLSIIDPNNPENDISGGSSNYPAIRVCFAKAYSTLQNAMMQFSKEMPLNSSNDVKNTLLYSLLAGNYAHFELQRNWLRKLDQGEIPGDDIQKTAYNSNYTQW
ncbi:hypothetical protein GQX73_g9047 [Xylaria multiplex]|uniref:polynucleotide adenylyltransferase n=1 Tax=Xylaria multiplex TaxID=323545 RepID=A0A7C8IMZ3_9PEZI|nr:hypothetical protein GQX73_g9047 [Xylaria multiplex]